MRARISLTIAASLVLAGSREPITCTAPRTAASGFLTSCAITAAISPSRASAVASRSRSSSSVRRDRSCRMPVKCFSPSISNSPTERCSGKIWPSRRWPLTARPMPMILLSPVVEVMIDVAVVVRAMRLRHQHADVLPEHLGFAVAEHPLGGGVERLDAAARIDDDDAVDRGVDDRAPARVGDAIVAVGIHAGILLRWLATGSAPATAQAWNSPHLQEKSRTVGRSMRLKIWRGNGVAVLARPMLREPLQEEP